MALPSKLLQNQVHRSWHSRCHCRSQLFAKGVHVCSLDPEDHDLSRDRHTQSRTQLQRAGQTDIVHRKGPHPPVKLVRPKAMHFSWLARASLNGVNDDNPIIAHYEFEQAQPPYASLRHGDVSRMQPPTDFLRNGKTNPIISQDRVTKPQNQCLQKRFSTSPTTPKRTVTWTQQQTLLTEAMVGPSAASLHELTKPLNHLTGAI